MSPEGAAKYAPPPISSESSRQVALTRFRPLRGWDRDGALDRGQGGELGRANRLGPDVVGGDGVVGDLQQVDRAEGELRRAVDTAPVGGDRVPSPAQPATEAGARSAAASPVSGHDVVADVGGEDRVVADIGAQGLPSMRSPGVDPCSFSSLVSVSGDRLDVVHPCALM